MNLEVLGEDLLAAVRTRLHNALHDATMYEAAHAAAVRELAKVRAELEELKKKYEGTNG